MADRYWVGGSGNWNSSDTTNWSTSSGGANGASVPTSSDNVIFDANSKTTAGDCIITLSNSPRPCRDLNFSAEPSGGGRFNFSGSNVTLSVSGSLTLLSTATANLWGGVLNTITVEMAGSGSFNITTNGGSLPRVLTFNNAGGTWTAQDDWTYDGNNGSQTLALTAGTFDHNGKTFTRTTGNDMTFSGNTWTLANFTHTGTANIGLSTNLTITGTLTLTGTSANSRLRLNLSAATGTTRTLTAAAVALTDVDIRDIAGAGAAAPFTGTRLGDCEGNSGITFTAAADKFWVGNSANANTANWATTSGGAGATNNFPLAQDTVVFDANSFNANGQTCTFNSGCRIGNITASGVDQTGCTMACSSSGLEILGDVTIASPFAFSGSINTTFTGRTTQSIDLGGSTFTAPATINSIGGTWQLASSYTATSSVTFTRGTLDLNGFDLTATSFSSNNSNTRTLDLSGGGTMSLTGTGSLWDTNNVTNLTFVAGNPVQITNSGATGRTLSPGTSNTISGSMSFDVTAGTGSLSISSTHRLKDLNFTGFSGSLGTAGFSMLGNLTLSAGMTSADAAGTISFIHTSGTKTITSSGIALNRPVQMNGAGGTVQLADNLNLGARALTVASGHFDANDFDVTCNNVDADGSTARTVSMGSGDWTLTGTGTVWDTNANTNLTLNEETSRIIINDASATAKTFDGGGETFYDLLLTGTGTGTFDFVGSNTFHDFVADTPPHTIRFTAGTTTTVTHDFAVDGTSGNLMTIGSITASGHNLVFSGSGVILCDYLSVSRSTATPTAPTETWFAGSHSTDGGNNSGWFFTDGAVLRAGSVTGTSTVSGVSSALKAALGVSSGSATVSGVSSALAASIAAAVGDAAVSGASASLFSSAGAASGTGTASGASAALIAAVASAAGAAVVDGVGFAQAPVFPAVEALYVRVEVDEVSVLDGEDGFFVLTADLSLSATEMPEGLTATTTQVHVYVVTEEVE